LIDISRSIFAEKNANKTDCLQKSGKRVWQFTVQPYQIAFAGTEDGYFDPVETAERRYCHRLL